MIVLFICEMEKGDSTLSVKTIKEKYHNWESKNLWVLRLFEYILLVGLISFSVACIFKFFNLIYTDATSARYMLSALVQSQAAIVAIVVSLTLIAVQLTASAYSPRVIDIFKKNPDMWILLGLYGMSIFYGLLVLKLIGGAEDTSQIIISNISLEAYITVVYALGISTFVILFPYMWNIMNLLKPERIINRLAKEITKENLLNSEEDPVQPIMDIVHGSIMKYDIETTRVGLEAVTERVIEIIDSDGEKEISERFCNHLERVHRLAISKEDEEAAEKVIENLEKFGVSSTEKGLAGAASTAVEFIEGVGVNAAKKGLVLTAWQAVDSLEAVGEVAVEEGHGGIAVHVARYLGNFGLSAAEEDKGIIKKIAGTLESVGKKFVEYELEEATKQAAQALANLTVREETVKAAIIDYESNLKEPDHAVFQKFIKIYEQKFEELRAEKKNSE